MKKALEVEYWVVDEDGALTTPGELADVSEYVEEEFVEPLFELKTPPCESHAELEETFLDQLDRILARASELGKLLVPFGTPINGLSIDRHPGERTEIQERVIGTEFEYANYCAGTHLHFEKRNVTDQLNVLIALDPALALLNSSPYFQGERVADSARAYLYRKKCYEEFPDHGQLWDYVETVAEWDRRRDRRFEEFRAAAIEAGVAEDDVDAHFSPDDVVWSPVRLREAMPTVEWRAPDASLPSQVLRLARDVETVMERVSQTVVTVEGDAGRVGQNRITIPEIDVVRDRTDAAIHDGVDSTAVSAYLKRMGFDVQEYDPLSRKIDGREYLSSDDACDLRRRYGNLLRRDVDALRRKRAE